MNRIAHLLHRLSVKKFGTILIILCGLSVLSFVACGSPNQGRKKPIAVRGVIDLGAWDCEKEGPVSLDGEWEFCWGRILGPSDFVKTGAGEGCGFIPVPGLWEGRSVNGVKLPGAGKATYRLKILSGTDHRVSLSIHRIFSAYELWINGALADKKGLMNGSPGTREDYIYIHNKKLSSFTLRKGENEIILHVFNHDYKSGGIDQPPLLGDSEITARNEFLRYTINMVVIGLLLFGALYNILSYFFRKTDTASLIIGIASLAWAINTYNIQSPIFSVGYSYPANPFFINYITVILGTTLCVMIIRSLFPDDFSARVIRFAQGAAAVCIVPLFFAGFRTAEQIMKIYFIFLISIVVYCMYVFIKTIKNRRDDAGLFFIGFLALFAAGINNILYALWIIDTGNIFHYGMVVLCFVTTLVVSRRYARAMRRVENLSEDLADKNIALEKSNWLKDRFLANTSHELRTPLHGMIGLSESMIEGAAGDLPPKALENLSLIASSGHRLAGMVNDLLDMAKIQDSGLKLNQRNVDLHALGEMVVKLSLPLAGKKRLEIINRIDPDMTGAWADEDRIRQVLYNLIGNAVKFTHEGSVEVSARVVRREDNNPGGGEMIEVSVSDTGIGVPDEYRKKIFEAYQQVDAGDTRAFPGTGLGLAIAKKIVELHNGKIWVESGKNGGSIFSFTLPAAGGRTHPAKEEMIIEHMDAAWSPEEVPESPRLPAGFGDNAFDNSPVLLVVDDDQVNVRVLQSYFESKKCVVKTALDGISALDILERDRSVSLVLLDIMMPVMSGYEVCRRIRESRPPEDLPVIMLTAKNMMADIDAAFAAGANDYVVKPFRVTELLARVGTMLKLRNVRRSAAESIAVSGAGRAYTVKFSGIVHITSHSKHIVIHTTDGDVELPVLMKEIIDRLPPDIFMRIHKRHIINLNFYHSMSHVLSGRYRVRLRDADDTELPVGPAYLDALRKKFN